MTVPGGTGERAGGPQAGGAAVDRGVACAFDMFDRAGTCASNPTAGYVFGAVPVAARRGAAHVACAWGGVA